MVQVLSRPCADTGTGTGTGTSTCNITGVHAVVAACAAAGGCQGSSSGCDGYGFKSSSGCDVDVCNGTDAGRPRNNMDQFRKHYNNQTLGNSNGIDTQPLVMLGVFLSFENEINLCQTLKW